MARRETDQRKWREKEGEWTERRAEREKEASAHTIGDKCANGRERHAASCTCRRMTQQERVPMLRARLGCARACFTAMSTIAASAA
eukprot:589600-Pleurochrysis_carterae.AAC.1